MRVPQICSKGGNLTNRTTPGGSWECKILTRKSCAYLDIILNGLAAGTGRLLIKQKNPNHQQETVRYRLQPRSIFNRNLFCLSISFWFVGATFRFFGWYLLLWFRLLLQLASGFIHKTARQIQLLQILANTKTSLKYITPCVRNQWVLNFLLLLLIYWDALAYSNTHLDLYSHVSMSVNENMEQKWPSYLAATQVFIAEVIFAAAWVFGCGLFFNVGLWFLFFWFLLICFLKKYTREKLLPFSVLIILMMSHYIYLFVFICVLFFLLLLATFPLLTFLSGTRVFQTCTSSHFDDYDLKTNWIQLPAA